MQVVERNPEGGISRTSYDYDLVGNVVRYKELRQPYAGADEDMVTASYVYDNRRRLIREVRALNYENSVAVDYEYDDLGKLVGKTTRNGGLNTTMAYNLQGWQTDMQVTDSGSPLFDTHLRYYDPQYGETTPSYAGNISEWTWRQGGESDENTYAFTYDSHSRLTDTKQYINGMPDNQFIETGFSYDLNSNIKALKRYDKGILKDSYNYNYLGNQLLAIYVRPVSSRNAVPQSVDFAAAVPVDSAGLVIRDPLDPGVIIPPVDPNNPFDPTDPTGPIKPVNPGDPDDPGPGITVPPGLVVDPTDPGKYDPTIPVFPATPDENEGDIPDPIPDPAVPIIPRDTIYNGVGYVYDSAGNVLYDSHAGLNLRYNDLNLIEKVMRGDTIVAKYSYLSDGTKFSATDSAGNGLYYSGSLIYTKHGAALTMESCAFTGGRFVATATGVEARYFVTDHLGSVRAVVNGEGEVLERNDYYPFGSRWDDGLLSDNRYRYNGKEAQAFLNNPYLDYGARQYDSDGAVWLGKDPLSEKYYPISPYSFCANNPIKFVDSDGRKVYYAPGVSQKFKDKFAATIKYMNSRGSAGDIASLEKSDKVYYIGDKDSAGKSNKFVVDGTQTTIYWDPDTAYQTTEGIWISPATVLAHEVGHAIEYDKQPNEFMQNVKKEDGDYDNVEERRNITTTEQKAARKHKEIKDGTVTRRNHKMADKSNVNNLTPYEIEDKFRKINEFINNSN